MSSTQTDTKGPSRMALHRATKRGELTRIARGIYVPEEASIADWDMLEATIRRPDATVCLVSALSYYDLTDEIPKTLDVAIPRGARIPAGSETITWHLFDENTFMLERKQLAIPGAEHEIGIYSAARSVVDAFRLRGDVGYEVARDALKEWLRRGGKSSRLIELASQLPRAKSPLLQALELLA